RSGYRVAKSSASHPPSETATTAARATPRASRTSPGQRGYARDDSAGRAGALRPGSPMTSTAYTRKRSDHAATSGAHIDALEPEPCRSTSGGASGGPEATTKV